MGVCNDRCRPGVGIAVLSCPGSGQGSIQSSQALFFFFFLMDLVVLSGVVDFTVHRSRKGGECLGEDC